MKSRLTWLDVYLFIRDNHQAEYFLSDLQLNISWVSLLDGVTKLETLGIINSRRENRKKVLFKTQKFYELQPILDEISVISMKG